MGNIHSAGKALECAGARVVLAETPDQLKNCDRIFLPGVGGIRACIDPLCERGFDEALALSDKPLLAVCVGMQLLFEHSEENGGTQGLGMLPGRVSRFASAEDLCIPHIGWNRVRTDAHPLWDGLPQEPWFYFVHSYRVAASPSAQGRCDYGGEFVAAAGESRIFAVQFHPEKSQAVGLRLLRNFIRWG
ncbi:MAG: imidazole glycerol phosphate synthase subunit HisH [Gammaproteobacteria bacterium AqS3]|nr:imidazole glycerol phosphate synthase subunit HisH [Gammaproteobacteria bacterium AqS3]